MSLVIQLRRFPRKVLPYRKYEERHKLREELLNIKELGLDYFEKSQLVHIAKDTEVKK